MTKGSLNISTDTRMELVDITAEINNKVKASGVREGICHIYNPHTTAGLTINEGADPDVQRDIIAAMKEIVPLNYPYKHLEGNSPAHIMASFMGSSVSVFVEEGRLRLGTWQKVFFCEFDGPRSRKVLWKMISG